MDELLQALLILVFLLSACAPYQFRKSQMDRNEAHAQNAYKLIGTTKSEEENDKWRSEFHEYRNKRNGWVMAFFILDIPYYVFLLWLYYQLTQRFFS